MITIYNIKKSDMINHPNGEVFYLLELRGLSTDEKPKTIENGTIENGSVFIEIDTQDVYIYDGENEEWLPSNAVSTNESLDSDKKEIIENDDIKEEKPTNEK
jgi:hypothetical protein